MFLDKPLLLSQGLLAGMGTRTFVYHSDRIPRQGATLVVANHRSFQDAPLLMAALGRSIHFATHHYMGQVPGMRQAIKELGGFPLAAPGSRQHGFFAQANQYLQNQRAVGVFPEGTPSMVEVSPPSVLGDFERGFAHLAFRSPVADLAVLPVAIRSEQETCHNTIPLKWLSWFDPAEPLFQGQGLHPMVVYQRVSVLIGRPRWIQPQEQAAYRGKQGRVLVKELTQHCYQEIEQLLRPQAEKRTPAVPTVLSPVEV